MTDKESEMIERVAKAINNFIDNEETSLAAARAALRAMLEPTSAMTHAGASEILFFDRDFGDADDTIAVAWRAMISGALGEE